MLGVTEEHTQRSEQNVTPVSEGGNHAVGMPDTEAFDIFFGFLRGMQLTTGKITSSSAIDVLNNSHAVYKHIGQNLVRYICYDLATQDHDNKCLYIHPNTASHYGWNPQKLLRFVVFAFAYGLSAEQRKAVAASLNVKINESGIRLHKQDEYFWLLGVVDSLRSHAFPDVADNQFIFAVESVVDLLVSTISGKTQYVPDTRMNILIMLLEANFLLRAAAGAYETMIIGGSATCSISRRATRLMACLGRIFLTHEELHDALDYVRDYHILDNIGKVTGLEELRSTLLETQSYYDHTAISNSTKTIGGMDSLSRQLEDICATCTELLAELSKHQNVLNPKAVTDNETNRSGLRSSKTSDIGICLQHNEQIVDEVYKMVVHGSSFMEPALLAEESVEPSLFIKCYAFSTTVLCSSVVAHDTKKLVVRLLDDTNYRILSTQEIGSLWSVTSMLSQLQKNVADFDEVGFSYRYKEVFRNFLANICINIALGDTCRVFGKDHSVDLLNSRVLELFINLFCTLPHTAMIDSRTGLKKTFREYGADLPHEVDTLLCLLIDLKYFSCVSSYTGEGENYSYDTEVYPSYYRDNEYAVCTLTTLAKLLAYSAHNNVEKTVQHNSVTHGLGWQDVIDVLLHEHIHEANTALMLACGVDILLGGGKFKFGKAHRVGFTVKKELNTVEDLITNKAEICSKIRESVQEIRDFLPGMWLYTYVADVGSNTSSQYLRHRMRSVYNKVYDTDVNKDLHSRYIDMQILSFLLLRSFISARHALDILCSGKLEDKSPAPPSLSLVLDDYFDCCKVSYNKNACYCACHGNDVSEKDSDATPSCSNADVISTTEVVPSQLASVDVTRDALVPPPLTI